jgi:membrane protease YdiL (CAAX protease family)
MSAVLRGVAALFVAAIVAVLIVAYGQGMWGFLVLANVKFHPELPWAAPVMAVLLVVLLLYLGGFGPPVGTAAARRRLLRWNAIPPKVFAWSIFSGVLALVAMCGLWIALSDLVHIPPGITPSMRGIPLPTIISILVMATLAAPLSEEAAFRGYAQGMLEKAWGWAPSAIVGSSLLFAAVHFTQGLYLPKLGLYFTAGLIFGTIAYLTNSLYAAMVVHCLADFAGFLLLWPHDAHPHALITEGGHDPLFIPSVVAMIVFTPIAIAAFRRLARQTAEGRATHPGTPAAAPA